MEASSWAHLTIQEMTSRGGPPTDHIVLRKPQAIACSDSRTSDRKTDSTRHCVMAKSLRFSGGNHKSRKEEGFLLPWYTPGRPFFRSKRSALQRLVRGSFRGPGNRASECIDRLDEVQRVARVHCRGEFSPRRRPSNSQIDDVLTKGVA